MDTNLNGNGTKSKISKPRIGKGDYGCTEFIGSAVSYKSSWQAEACGTVDELNAILGEVYLRMDNEELKSIILNISHIFIIILNNILHKSLLL